ncbi:unnamed protein product [Trichobilharzia szidati]|nr:unnamed protein product [Trichobilharzia szidati]
MSRYYRRRNEKQVLMNKSEYDFYRKHSKKSSLIVIMLYLATESKFLTVNGNPSRSFPVVNKFPLSFSFWCH